MISNKDMPAMPTRTYDHSAAMQGLAVTVTDQPGLTKREMFAMHAMQGLLAANSGWRNSNPMTSDIIVNEASYIADALLEELERTK